MEVLHCIKKRVKFACSTLFFISCLLSSSNAVVAEEYQLEVLAQLPTLSSAKNIALIPLPIDSNNKHQYLLADETGELSLLDGNNLHSLSRLPLSVQAANPQTRLTALTLHPSFSLAEKTGYQTFFTAHIEPIKTNNNVARLTQLKNPTPLPFDAVVTQWKYDSSAIKVIDVKQRREVLRIAVPTATHQIQKIAFNPYNKIWYDDYGLMHVALSENNHEHTSTKEDALYSGVVLRINPEKFGLRNYMIPNSNPFAKTSDINKEIFILGAKNIKSFSWSKQHHDALLVQHIYDDKHQVAVAKKGTDWREAYQNKLVFLFESKIASNSEVFTYYGRKLKTFVGNILYLSKNTTNWQLAKLNTAPNIIETKEKPSATTIELLNNGELAPQSKISLFFDHANEPLILDHTRKQLLSITVNQTLVDSDDNKAQITDSQDEQTSPENSNTYGKLLFILLLLILSAVFYQLRPKRNAAKVKLRNQFARFELDDTKTTLSFYKRHQSEIDSQLNTADIIKSEVFLNDNSVCIINKDNGNGFNEQRENQLRLSFTQAHRHKLIDKEIRQVNLYLTDKSAKTHVICLYLRKGNQRLTKAKYFDTLETAIDWSWFIANQLNPADTGIRPEKETIINKPRAKVHTKPKISPVNVPKSESKTEPKEPEIIKQTQEELHDIAVHDSELINALDKLVNLKQQGFLTDEEFSLAKAKILSDMASNN